MSWTDNPTRSYHQFTRSGTLPAMPTPVTTIGLAHDRKAGLPFGLRQPDRLQHVLCLGKTGTGKSTLLRTLALQDARHDQGFCLIDPHGDLAQDVFPPIVWRNSALLIQNAASRTIRFCLFCEALREFCVSRKFLVRFQVHCVAPATSRATATEPAASMTWRRQIQFPYDARRTP